MHHCKELGSVFSGTCSKLLTISGAIHWNCSSSFMRFMHWWHQILEAILDARAKYRGIITSHNLLSMFLQIQPRMLLNFFGIRADCCLTFTFLSIQTQRSFSAVMLPSQPVPTCTAKRGHSFKIKNKQTNTTLHLSLLNSQTPVGVSLQFV